MNVDQRRVAEECAALSAEGRIHFGEVAARLTAAAIERYHADYTRNETTYYTAQGGSCVVPLHRNEATISSEFSAPLIETAVRLAQRGDIKYEEFTRQVIAAGCVGYFVQLTGQCVQYFGRNGEMHVEGRSP